MSFFVGHFSFSICRWDGRNQMRMEALLKDIRYGFRNLLKRPSFTGVAVITLALGIGANTAIFTLLNAVLLKPLPVHRPEELVLFNDSASEGTSDGDPAVGRWTLFSNSAYQYFRDNNHSFQSLAAFRSGESRLSVRDPDSAGQAAQRAQGHMVSGNYFLTLGVNPLLGRLLNPSDDSPEARPAAVISYGYWKQVWKSDSTIVGKNLILNGTSFTVVGITRPEFFGVRVRKSPDFWIPLSFQPQIELRNSYLQDQRVYWLSLIGRLKSEVSLEQAQAEANLQLHQFLTQRAGSKLTDQVQADIGKTYLQLAPGARGISGLRFAYAGPLQMLMVMVALVLIIACANVGNLLLSRATSRQAEMSLRMALGASRTRLVRQLLTESMLLGALGGILGIILAQWGVSALVTLVAKTSPLDVRPDALVLSFTAGLSILASLLFGLAPAIRASKTDLTSALKEKVSGGGRQRFALASILIVGQVCLSLVLLTAAGLFARSLMKLQEAEVGFNRDNVLLVGIDPRLAGYKPSQLSAFYQQVLSRVNSLPGVVASTVASYAPMGGTKTLSSLIVQGYTSRPGEDLVVEDLLVGPNYSATLGVPLLLGRDIRLDDTASSNKVALVNQAFAEYFFHGANPIGRQFTFGDEGDPKAEQIEIVGVVADMKFSDARTEPLRTTYRPILQVQDQSAYASSLQIRTSGDPLTISGTVRQAIAQVDDRLPISNVTSLREQLEGTLRQERLIARLVSFFGLLALLLACVGLYGVMGHAVSRRTNEIGIRIALGAERRDIVWMVLRDTLVLVGVGLAVGIPAALTSARLVRNQLFGLSATDPLTIAGAAIILTIVAVVAGYLPARRASRVDPLIALRYE